MRNRRDSYEGVTDGVRLFFTFDDSATLSPTVWPSVRPCVSLSVCRFARLNIVIAISTQNRRKRRRSRSGNGNARFRIQTDLHKVMTRHRRIVKRSSVGWPLRSSFSVGSIQNKSRRGISVQGRAENRLLASIIRRKFTETARRTRCSLNWSCFTLHWETTAWI